MKFIFTIFLTLLFVNANQFEEERLQLHNTNEQTATINRGSLIIGQSGIIMHKFKNNKSIILTHAIVSNSNDTNSTIKFVKSNILTQNALPQTNVKPLNQDIFVLNHLSTTSLLITPNFESKQRISTAYYKNNFIDTDIFAAWLKINSTPVPKKEDFIKFTSANNIGTLFLQVDTKLYIIDTISFKIIQTRDIHIRDKKTQVPFFSNVQNIEKSMFAWFSSKKIENYSKYYKNLIGLKNDRK